MGGRGRGYPRDVKGQKCMHKLNFFGENYDVKHTKISLEMPAKLDDKIWGMSSLAI